MYSKRRSGHIVMNKHQNAEPFAGYRLKQGQVPEFQALSMY